MRYSIKYADFDDTGSPYAGSISAHIYDAKSLSDSNKIQEYERLLAACDKKAYSVKELDIIGDKMARIVAPLMDKVLYMVKDKVPGLGSLSEGLYEGSSNILSKVLSTKNASYRYMRLSELSGSSSCKLKSIEKSAINIAESNGIIVDSFLELEALNKSISKKSQSMGVKNIAKSTSGFAKSIPFIGIVTDVTVMCKNIYESWINGKKIIQKLPLSKYGITLEEATIPLKTNISNISKKLEELSNKYSESPAELFEILEIAQTLKGYSTDFVSAILNFLMVILDIVEFFGIGSLVSFVLSIPLISLEVENDIFAESSYDKVVENIRLICNKKIGYNNIELSESNRDFIKGLIEESGL